MSGLRNFSSALTAVMLAIFVTMVVIASGYPAGARFMPYVVGIPGIVLCLLQLLLDWRRTSIEPVRAGQPKALPDISEAVFLDGTPESAVTVKRELLIWGYFLGFIALILVFGFYVAVPLLILSFLRFEGETSWLVAISAAAFATIVLYVAFALVLRLPLFAGHYGPAAMDLLGF